jgi:hypothetical protein
MWIPFRVSTSVCQKLLVTHLFKKFLAHKDPEGSRVCSQDSATGHQPKSDDSDLHSPILHVTAHFNFVFSSAPRFLISDYITKSLMTYVVFFSPMHATCFKHLMFLNFIILISSEERIYSWIPIYNFLELSNTSGIHPCSSH